MDSIPSSKLSRISVYGASATKVGYNIFKHKAKKLVNSKLQDDELLEENSKIIFEALTKLRGTALKMAQLLSLENGLLSDKYLKELEKSTYRVRPLNRAVVRKTIKNELGDYPENIFESFDSKAFAAASLGQVHKAKDKMGNSLAVKMQYPGIDKTLKQDLEMIRLSLKVMPHSKVVIDTLDEVEETLEEEVSYLTEAKNLKYFQEKMAEQDVIIPKLFPNYSNDKILTMEYLEGRHLDQWLEENPSQELKNLVAQKIFDLYVYSFFELKTFQADSNIGNYLFMGKSDIAFLDFGCVKTVNKNFPKGVVELVHACEINNKEAIIQAFISLGFIKSKDNIVVDKFYDSVFIPLAQWTCQPYLKKIYSFSKDDDYASSAREAQQIISREKEFVNYNRDFVYFHRGLYGLYKMFEQMEVSIELRSRLPKV